MIEASPSTSTLRVFLKPFRATPKPPPSPDPGSHAHQSEYPRMETQAHLLQPVIDQDHFSLLSHEGEVLLYCDPKQLVLRAQELPRTTPFRLEVIDQVLQLQFANHILREPSSEWPTNALAELAAQFHRFGLDLWENCLSASQRGALFVEAPISEAERSQAESVDYAAVHWQDQCLVIGGHHWDPIRRRLDNRPVQRIRADHHEQMGDTKTHYFYLLAFDDLVLVERGKEYFERLSQNDPSDNDKVCQNHQWVCSQLRLPFEAPQPPAKPSDPPSKPPTRPLTKAENLTCCLGCLGVMALIMLFLYKRLRDAGMPPLSQMWGDFLLTWPRWLLFGVGTLLGLRLYTVISARFGPFLIHYNDRHGKPGEYGPGCLGCLPAFALGVAIMPYLSTQAYNWNGSVALTGFAMLTSLAAFAVDLTPRERQLPAGKHDLTVIILAALLAALALIGWR